MENRMKAFTTILSAALCIAMSTVAWGQKTWTGGDDGTSWSQSSNWSGGTAPINSDNVLLDNSIVAGSYTVNLPTGATTVSINRLTITPDAGNTITLILPSGNTASMGFNVGDATAGTDDIILNNGAVLKNSSGAGSGNGLQANSTSNGTVRINNGGKYIHNTSRSTAGVVPLLSTVSGTETGIFEYDSPGTGSVAISASGRNYGSLILTRTAGAAIYTASGASVLTIRGNFLINTGVTFNSTMTGAMNLAGNLTNNGAFTPGVGAVTMNGTSAQTMSGNAITFTNLTITNAAGVTLSVDETVTSTLMLNRNITTGSNKMIIAAGGMVSRTSGHIVGNLQKNFATGAGVVQTFEVGTGSDYTPVEVTIAQVDITGNVTAKSTSGDHPSIGSSTLDATKSINRYWTLMRDAGLTFTGTYDATFNFVSGDLDAGTNTSNLSVGKLDGGTWSYPTVGARTATSTQATGMTSFSDFQLAEPSVPEIDVLGNAISIADGDASPSAADDTDFGSADISVPPGGIDHVFTIKNTGSAALNLTGAPDKVQISGTNAGDFSVTVQPTSPVAASSGTSTFTVHFDPSATGVRSATISIDNDDSDENPYDFAIQGLGTAAAATATVSGNATICAGSSTTLTATLTGTAPWNLTWSDGHVQNGVTASPATRSVSPTTTTVYTLTSFSDVNGPGTASGSATVTVTPNSVVANAGADLATTAGVSAKIGANPTASGGTGPLTINWSPSTGLSSTTASNPTATPSSTTTYTLTVTDANGCTSADQITVRAGNLVNSLIKSVIGPTNLYDPVLNQVRVDIAIKNISGAPIYGPLSAVFKTLTPGPPTITIPNANGGGEGVGCYYDYSNLLGPDNILSPGETSGYKLWIFQEHVIPPVSIKFFANIVGDLDGIPKTATDNQPLAFAFDLQKAAVQDDADSKSISNSVEIPKTYAMHQNHPNPFNPSTTIQFDLPEPGNVTLKIYNSVGQLVRTLLSGDYAAGAHKVIWDALNDRGVGVASGVYLAVFKAGEVKQVRRVVLMK